MRLSGFRLPQVPSSGDWAPTRGLENLAFTRHDECDQMLARVAQGLGGYGAGDRLQPPAHSAFDMAVADQFACTALR